MFTCARVQSIEYYVATSEDAKASQRDAMAYYTDDGAGEDDGRWIGRSAPTLGVEAGSIVDPKQLRTLANGCSAATGEVLIQANTAKRTAAYDLQFAAPKSVSALYGTGDETQRAALVAIHRKAVERAMEFARAEGLVETRRGAQGKDREAVDEIAVAAYTHTTTRAGDPQLHDHALILNVCTRKDGTTGTLDNAALLKYQGAMGAVYRAELAAGLERELGLAVSRADRAFKVDGVPEELVELWSKRRDAIEDAMLAKGGGTTAENRAGAQVAALDTRNRKSDLPEREELEKKWTREIRSVGHTAASVWTGARIAREGRDERLANPDEDHNETTSEERAEALTKAKATAAEKAGGDAIASLEANAAVIERRHLLKEVVERMQGVGDANAAVARVDALLRTRTLVKVGTLEEDGEEVYATPAMISTERAMLRNAMDRRNERDFVNGARVEAAIVRKAGISQEQADAVRHALNRDGVAIVEGSAGAGKSFSMGAVADAARDCGLQVHVLAPSWKATDVIRADTDTAEEYARALRGFLNRVDDEEHPDHIQLTSKSVLLVDEAGMVGTHEMESLLRHAREAGAKVVLAGDTRQLQPVAAGSAMAAIVRECGTQRIEEIRRQKVEWQRAASADFATGQADRALDAYHVAGKVKLEAGRTEAIERLAADWTADMVTRPGETRIALAYLNRDVGEMNALMRASYRDEGRLQGDDVAVTAIGRGQHGKAQELRLAVGERVIFGETVRVGGPNGTTVNNSDVGTVEEVGQGPDPFIRVKLDKGTMSHGRLSEFVGHRAKDAAPETQHPKMQHAYAVSIHASQGTTVDRAYVLNSQGLKAQSAYVAMTRHRLDATMYVDAKRIEDKLAARKSSGSTVRVSKAKGASAPDADDEQDASQDVTAEEVMKQLRAEVQQAESKRNVSDFVKPEDKAAWLEGREAVSVPPNFPPPTPHESSPADVTATAQALDQVDEFLASAKADLPPPARPARAMVSRPQATIRRPAPTQPATAINQPAQERPKPVPALPRPFAQVQLRRPADDLARRMQARAEAPIPYPPPPPPERTVAGRTPSQELDHFAREFPFKEWLEQAHGYEEVEAWSGAYRMARGVGAHPEHPGDNRRGEKELIIKSGAGAGNPWHWSTHRSTNPDNVQGVGPVAFLQRVEGYGHGTLGRIRQELRAYEGISRDDTARENAPATKADSIRRDLAAATKPSARAYDFAPVRRIWNDCRDGVNEYLRDVRGIKAGILDRFHGQIKNEPTWNKQNPQGFCVAHLNDAGEVVGFERKGPKARPEDARSFSFFSKCGQKTSTRLLDGQPVRNVYAGESATDLLSVYQHDGAPKGVAICSMAGETTADGCRSVGRFIAKNPGAKVHLAYDGDAAGQAMADKTERLIREEAPDAEIVRRPPPKDFKDWNDCVTGKTISGAQANAEAEAARLAEEEARRRERERERVAALPAVKPTSAPRLQ